MREGKREYRTKGRDRILRWRTPGCAIGSRLTNWRDCNALRCICWNAFLVMTLAWLTSLRSPIMLVQTSTYTDLSSDSLGRRLCYIYVWAMSHVVLTLPGIEHTSHITVIIRRVLFVDILSYLKCYCCHYQCYCACFNCNTIHKFWKYYNRAFGNFAN